jgi:hypothetical protein
VAAGIRLAAACSPDTHWLKRLETHDRPLSAAGVMRMFLSTAIRSTKMYCVHLIPAAPAGIGAGLTANSFGGTGEVDMSLPQWFVELSPGAIIAIIVLAVTQLSLQVIGLVHLARHDEAPGGRKWVWVLVIVMGAMIGPLVYLAVARQADRTRADAGEVPAGGEAAARRAVDDLYGPGGRS